MVSVSNFYTNHVTVTSEMFIVNKQPTENTGNYIRTHKQFLTKLNSKLKWTCIKSSRPRPAIHDHTGLHFPDCAK